MGIRGIRFLSDDAGTRTAVVIDLRQHRRVWEDMYDVIVAESRKHEPRIPWEAVKRRLRSGRKRRG